MKQAERSWNLSKEMTDFLLRDFTPITTLDGEPEEHDDFIDAKYPKHPDRRD